MAERVARKKTLYTVPVESGARPALRCGRCVCGHVFFPPQRLGCEVCGAPGDRLEIVELAPEGVLQALAPAHRLKRPDGGTPLWVGTVRLDAGPVFEAALDVTDASGLAAGRRVEGRLVDVGRDDEGRVVVDLFFAPAGGPG